MLYADTLTIPTHPVTHDPQDKKFYSFGYMPAVWRKNTAATKGQTLYVPTLPNGLMYECKSGGITGNTEPDWNTEEGKITVDSDVAYKGILYSALLNKGDVIVSSTWSGNGVQFDNSEIVSSILTRVRVVAVPAKKATITNHIKVRRRYGYIEEFDRSIVLTIAEV